MTLNISDYRQFSDIHISQGSVATYVRCGGIFKFAAHLPATYLQHIVYKAGSQVGNICSWPSEKYS